MCEVEIGTNIDGQNCVCKRDKERQIKDDKQGENAIKLTLPLYNCRKITIRF